jgi:hypothetical protein
MKEYLTLWWIQALVISIATSAILNGASYLPFFKDIKPRRIEARWVGYAGLTAALAIWIALNREAGAWQVMGVWLAICVGTLIPNTLIHLRERDRGSNGRGPDLPPIVIVSADKCEEILQHLVDPRRNLVVAQEGIRSAILRAGQAAERMPDQISGQIWVQAVKEPLDTASQEIEEATGNYIRLYEAVSSLWQLFNEIRDMWKHGFIPVYGES